MNEKNNGSSKAMPEKEFEIIKKVKVEEGSKDLYGRAVRIVLKTTEMNISHKPKTTEKASRIVNGFTVTRTEYKPVLLSEIPEVFVKIEKKVVNNGSCKIIAPYHIFTNEKGEFPYFSPNDLEKIRFIKDVSSERIKEESLED